MLAIRSAQRLVRCRLDSPVAAASREPAGEDFREPASSADWCNCVESVGEGDITGANSSFPLNACELREVDGDEPSRGAEANPD